MSNRINPWEHPLAKELWKTKSSYFTWLRGNLRKIWQDNPLRKIWKQQQLRPVTEEEKQYYRFHPATKNVGECYICKTLMAGSKLECDHIVGEVSCVDYLTAEEFLWHCAADNPANWALVCKPCHKDITYAERYKISIEEARATKKAIQAEKDKQVNSILQDAGVTPQKNAKLRRKQLVELFMKQGGQHG